MREEAAVEYFTGSRLHRMQFVGEKTKLRRPGAMHRLVDWGNIGKLTEKMQNTSGAAAAADSASDKSFDSDSE